jgi:hypothetical protein
MSDVVALVVDTTHVSEAALVRWARQRIDREVSELSDQLRAAGILDGETKFDCGLHFDLGAVMVRDRDTGAIYVPGPTSTLIGQTDDGREHLWRDGEQVYDLANPGAVMD